jgi:hypothetical protein
MKPVIKSTSSGIMIKTDGEYFSMIDEKLLFEFLDEYPESQKELLEIIHRSFVEKAKELADKLIYTGVFEVGEFVPYVNNATQYSQIVNSKYTQHIRAEMKK